MRLFTRKRKFPCPRNISSKPVAFAISEFSAMILDEIYLNEEVPTQAFIHQHLSPSSSRYTSLYTTKSKE